MTISGMESCFDNSLDLIIAQFFVQSAQKTVHLTPGLNSLNAPIFRIF